MIDQVISIVREASTLFWNRDFQVENKGTAANNVTSVDITVEAFLRERLTPLLENSSFIGEESEGNDFAHENLWIVDPIDGTTNFIRDLGCSAISVGLVRNNEAILGVVYNPYRDEMFYAEKGKGAYLNGQRIQVSDRDIEHSVFCTAMSAYDKALAKPCFNIIEKVYGSCEDIRRFGSAAVELASLAAGRVELYFEIRLSPWDYAASVCIIREAGGYIGTVEYDDIVYHRPIPVIAANTKENYEYLQSVVSAEIPKIPYTPN